MNLIGRKSKRQGKKKKEAKRENGPKQSAQCNLVNVVCINQFSHKKKCGGRTLYFYFRIF